MLGRLTGFSTPILQDPAIIEWEVSLDWTAVRFL